jgi:inosine-uridine nucleoside N-ribohydrolase
MTNLYRVIISVLLVLTVFSCSRSGQQQGADNRIRIILDTDANNELDDQHAIAYLLFSSDVFDVEGITVNATYNGGGVANHQEEAERIVRLCSLFQQIEVYPGADGNYQTIAGQIDQQRFDGSEAVDFIIRRANAKDDRKLVLLAIGKLTNVALALKKNPSIADKVRIVWLGSNYPAAGEYNLVNDTTAVNPVLESDAEIEIVTVRYDEDSGTAAVIAYLEDIRRIMPGKGPHITEPVMGRHGGYFTNFGDYSVELFEKFEDNPQSRPLFDMAAVAILKNPLWAERKTMPAPQLVGEGWKDQPGNPRNVILWENFDKDSIMADFYRTMEFYTIPTDRSR